MGNEALSEAYHRLHHAGPEWGEDILTNHGPMAAEVLARRGRADDLPHWVDTYLPRLDPLPRETDRIADDTWRDALGTRVGDWTAYFTRATTEQPWQDLLALWWPRLLPGIVAGATHGVIRVSHAVRALTAGADQHAVTELAHGLAFWAARHRAVPAATHPDGTLNAATALAAIPRIADQHGTVATRFGQLTDTPGWQAAQSALRPATTPDDVPHRLADIVTAATTTYLTHGHGSPVLLVHTATAPNAVLHALPALPMDQWVPSLAAVWSATAALIATYAPTSTDTPLTGQPTIDDAIDRAVAHGDEHVIKFTDTAADVYERTGDPTALAAAERAATLLTPPR